MNDLPRRAFVVGAGVLAVASVVFAGVAYWVTANAGWAAAVLVLLAFAATAGLYGASRFLPRVPIPPLAAPDAPSPAGITVTGEQIGMKGAVLNIGGVVDQSRRTRVNVGGAGALLVAALLIIGSIGGTAVLGTTGDGRFAGHAGSDASPPDPSVSPVAGVTPSAAATTAGPAPTLTSGASVVDFASLPNRVASVDAGARTVDLATDLTQAGLGKEPELEYYSYDRATGQRLAGPVRPDPAPDGNCDVYTVATPAGDILLDRYQTVVPAEGIYPAKYSVFLRALDAATLSTKWTASLATDVEREAPYRCATTGSLSYQLTVTTDRKFALLAAGSLIVDLSSGQTRPVSGQNPKIYDNYVLTVPAQSTGGYTVVDPATGTTVGHFVDDGYQIQPFDLSVDGLYLYTVHRRVDEKNVSGVVAEDLLTGADKWFLNTGATLYEGFTYDATADVVIGANPPGSRAVFPSHDVGAFDPKTGKLLWGPVTGDLCGNWDGKAYIAANGQLALVDLRSGKQLSYQDGFSSCPTMLDGLRYEEDAGLFQP